MSAFHPPKLALLKCLLIAIYLLGGCSTPRLQSKQTEGFSLEKLSTFSPPVFAINPTFRDTRQLQAKSSDLKALISAAFKEKGYRESSHDSEFKIRLRVTATEYAFTSQEELRFMKGAHGSGFPSADPRARTYRSDSLVLDIYSSGLKKPDFVSACRISIDEIPHPKDSSNVLPAGASTWEEALSCLNAVLLTVPTRKK